MKLPLLLLASSIHYVSVSASPIFQEFFSPGVGTRGAVASEAQECSYIGRDLLARGGNAVDAMIGTTFCVGVIGMYHSGIGGGGFMIVRDKKGNYEAIDFRESAPAAAFEDMYQGNVNGSIYGGLSVGVPGEVRGFEYAHKKYGSLPWKTVLQGAIKVAQDGFIGKSKYREEKEFQANKRQLIPEGEKMTRRRYARTLQAIAEHGADAFYTGAFAESMVKTIQKTNGTITLDDYKNYDVISREVLHTEYKGFDVYGISSPAGGAVSLNILNTMNGYTHQDEDRNTTLHIYIEAMKFAYGARLHLGDPDFVDGVPELEHEMLNATTAEKIRSKIDPRKTQKIEKYDPDGIYSSDGHGTSHVVTADGDGMAVSLTTTVNLIFGSFLMDPLTGVILNNEMNDFSIPGVPNEFGFAPAEANFIRPNKRPLSSCTPLIVSNKDGSLFAVIGAAGGSRIISATTQVAWRVLTSPSWSIKDAVREPRVHNQLIPNTLLVEKKFSSYDVPSLVERGHNITWVDEGLSTVQALTRDSAGLFEVAPEPRQKNSGGVTL
ncbi:gamma-glutamyltransferase [Fusarium subglutinans]|uniref:Gamma-glutamyltransferase n=1 Tax=Gibberella subglutinans TaxID=42677 RepID=A0A8H5QF56_GIBSU|nr:gamma-glutamyltransferase [Fusarium subglutinans]KAF5613483.1 gamma-glutamyltransferase [Fusarium subglutinans]